MTTVLDHLTAALKLSGEGREKLVAAMRQAKLTERDPEIVPVALMLTLRELIEQSRAELLGWNTRFEQMSIARTLQPTS